MWPDPSYMYACLVVIVFRDPAVTKIVLAPEDRVVMAGDSTIFLCSVNPVHECVLWIHQQPKVNDFDNQGDKEVYDCYSGVNAQFRERYLIDRNNSTGIINLHIKPTLMEDAGTYECQDENGYGEKHSAKLFVLDDYPRCESSVPLQKVIGANDCGIQPEEISLTCNVTFKGPKENQPMLEWRRVGDNQKLNQTCNVVGDRLSCTAMLGAALALNGTSYVCTTTQSATSQYNCTTETINVLYSYNTSVEQNVHFTEKLLCEANSSFECTYIWRKFQGQYDSWTVSNDRIFTPKERGSYRCEAICTIRNSTCHTTPRIVYAAGHSPVQGHSSSAEHTQFFTCSLCALLIELSLLYFNWYT